VVIRAAAAAATNDDDDVAGSENKNNTVDRDIRIIILYYLFHCPDYTYIMYIEVVLYYCNLYCTRVETVSNE